MKKNTKQFQERFERWKNGESYWDIVGRPLTQKEEQQPISPEEQAYYDSVVAEYENGKDSVIKNTIGYNQWRESLPTNLRQETPDYDLYGAYKAGAQPSLEDDGKYHLSSRDPYTGRILKRPQHETYTKAIIEDAKIGYFPTKSLNGYTYTDTWKGNQHGIDNGFVKYNQNDQMFFSKNNKKTTSYEDIIKYIFRNNAYNNISPNRYTNFKERIIKGIILNKDVDSIRENGYDKDRDDQWAQYLQIPKNARHKQPGIRKLYNAQYFPVIKIPFKPNDNKVFKMKLTNKEKESLINFAKQKELMFGREISGRPLDRLFGDHAIGRGVDDKGEYISYRDIYDINPFQGADTQKSTGSLYLDYKLRKYNGDVGKIIGAKPFTIYDRIYLDDYYGVDSSANQGTYYGGYLPEITIKSKK